MADQTHGVDIAIATALNLIVQIVVSLNAKGLLSVQDGQQIIQKALDGSASNPEDRVKVKALLAELFPNLELR